MSELLTKGYAERTGPPLNGQPVFYIPHHGIYNVNKPGKVRVVFDCSAKEAVKASLNDCLLQGPDLINSLIRVLCRFRLEPVAFLCNIEKMFFQFKVEARHRDFLRFFWWENGNIDSEPQEFCMTVHLFGATSSPGCSNFGLKQTQTCMVNTSQNFYMTISMLMMDLRAAQRHKKLQISSKGELQCAPKQVSGFINLQQMTRKSFSKFL